MLFMGVIHQKQIDLAVFKSTQSDQIVFNLKIA